MTYLPVSAFQRPMTYTDIELAHRVAKHPLAPPSVSKWALMRALVKAPEHYGLSARDLDLLQGLLTFYPHDELSCGQDIIIFPSNKTICQRMNGMAESTMRRHLRNLLNAGLLLRRDSNNGKRFTISYDSERMAFGFDLSPLLQRAPAIFDAAQRAEEEARQAKRLKLEVQLMRRDLYAMIPLLDAETAAKAQGYWDQTTKALRRKLSSQSLTQLQNDHKCLLEHLKTQLLSSTDSQNEQHNLNSNIKSYESESNAEPLEISKAKEEKFISLDVVIKACPEIESFYGTPIRHWGQLIEAAQRLYKAIGVTEASYQEAIKWLGLEQASVVLAALLQRFDKIRLPGAYLRSLVQKAAQGKFTCAPMIMALISLR